MLKAGVTIGCAAAMIAAGVLTFWLRHTRHTPSPLSDSEPFGERLAVTVSRTGGMLIGASLAGVLTIGAGSRLMMRVLAATSSDDVQGLQTEADEIVGNVSAGGSFFLIVIVGIGAALAGLALFGATFGVLVDRLAPRWPRPGWSPRGMAAVLPIAVLLLAPPLFIAAVIAILVGTVAPRLRPRAARGHSVGPRGGGAGSRRGHFLVMALGGLGSLSIVIAAGQVLAL